ncbi:ribosomal RNA methyltransferase FtsJ domain-containing protein [Fomes fomentarius]|nr:ribosomal RNA methyltransferase FtsJ domain-containing protein [Fomes fomentarius]
MTFRPTVPLLSHKLPPSSRAWLARQYRDPYVKARLSYPQNYRSRSAFKLLELDRKWGFLSYKDVRTVVDLGAAPGGWSQVVAAKLGWGAWDVLPTRPDKSASALAPSGYGLKKEAKEALRQAQKKEEGKMMQRKEASWSAKKTDVEEVGLEDDYADLLKDNHDPAPAGRGTIVAVDLLRMEPIAGVKTLQMDFLSSSADQYITSLLQDSDGKADVILSDMAANFTGNPTADMEAGLQICETVFEFAKRHLHTAESKGRRRGGALVIKHFAHPEAHRFRKRFLEPNFNIVVFEKPPASRSESREGYWVCLGWKGAPSNTCSSAGIDCSIS